MVPETPSSRDVELAALASQTSVVEWVDRVFDEAIRRRASDVHFEPFEDALNVRMRIDGSLEVVKPPPHILAQPIASRIKVLANLDIAERRVPQDGRISHAAEGRRIDLRVSTLPTVFGESVVVRILDRSAMNLEMEGLGLPADVLESLRELVRRPNGLVIVTGPTGSGKTTTLYSALRTINSPDLKLITAEDPIEFEIDGMVQVPVNPSIGLSFAAALRSFLRQDPDVIMIGEIRDYETAQIAVQSSLTGHLVLSTLHTNDAAGAVARLIDMGVEPFLIASSLEAVLAQRLVRRLCTECRVAYAPSVNEKSELGLRDSDLHDDRVCFHRSKGCERCNGTGYRGRAGLFEFLRVDAGIREQVMERAPALAMKQRALERGMRTLRADGIRAVLAGVTSVEEVLRYT